MKKRISVNEYLIAVNQSAKGVPPASLPRITYTRFGDALNALTDFAQVTPEGEEPVSLHRDDLAGGDFEYVPANTVSLLAAYAVGCYAEIGHVCAWKMDDNRVLYTTQAA